MKKLKFVDFKKPFGKITKEKKISIENLDNIIGLNKNIKKKWKKNETLIRQ